MRQLLFIHNVHFAVFRAATLSRCMYHIRYLLLPGERVLFNGRIHPVLYFPGLCYIALAVAVMYYVPQWAQFAPELRHKWWDVVGNYPWLRYLLPGVAAALFLFGVSRLMRAYLISYSTELVLTDRRIIAKTGITTTTTVEMDRHKIAGVIVTQTILGKLLNYGWVRLRGFSGDIAGLPAIINPVGLQKYVNQR